MTTRLQKISFRFYSKDQSPPRKRKRSDTFPGPIQRLKLVRLVSALPGSNETHLVNIPFRTQWANNSCAYDAAVVTLFNVWRENPEIVQSFWQEIRSDALDGWLDAFRKHESVRAVASEVRYTLDQIRGYLRRQMARSSEGHAFAFGEYTSNYLLTSGSTVTTSSRFCPNGHDADRRELQVPSCNITLSRRGCNLQEYLDDFTSI